MSWVRIPPNPCGIVQDLKNMGNQIILLTGDNKRTANAIAKKLEIDNVLAEVLPDKKAEEIKKLQDKGKKMLQ